MLPQLLVAGNPTNYNIQRSLRFRSSASAYLNRTPANAGNRKTWTWSGWVKRGALGVYSSITGSRAAPGAAQVFLMRFGNGDTFQIYDRTSAGTTQIDVQTTAVFRDPSAWYHVVVYLSTNDSTANQRIRLYINGVLQTLSGTFPPQGVDCAFNMVDLQQIGSVANELYFDGYLAEVNFIDGQALTPSSFGQTDAVTGVWTPKKYTGTYGTNGFYLPFSDNTSATTLAYDQRAGLQHVIVTESGGSASTNTGTGACSTPTISTSNYSLPSATNEYLTVNVSPSVTVTSSLKLYFDIDKTWANGRNLYINGNLVNTANIATATVSGMIEWTINYAAEGISTISSFTTPQNSGGRAVFYGISVNGSTVYRTANDWTPNNISTTAGATYDSMTDVPTLTSATAANYCTWNPLNFTTGFGVADGNLNANIPNIRGVSATIGMASGKWYAETTLSQTGILGITLATYSNSAASAAPFDVTGGYGYITTGNKLNAGVNSAYGASYTSTDIIGMAFDADAGTLTFYKNGTSQGTAFTGIPANTYVFAAYGASGTTNPTNAVLNCGQRPFSYTPPTGFKALNTFNLPDPVIKKPNQYMDATTWTGNSGSQSVSNSGFQPDFVWIKNRSNAYSHILQDAVRGVGKTLQSNTTNTEQNNGVLTSFDTSGFSLNNLTGDNVGSLVGWQWKESATAGFDIVTYTGTGSVMTIPHSLGVVPKLIISKSRTSTANWVAWHASLTVGQAIYPNLPNAAGSDPTVWNSTLPTSSNFTVGTFVGLQQHVAYLFAEIPGFSKFGSYTGNGSADGPFVYCGFRPKYILFKPSSTALGWNVYDTSRAPYNTTDLTLSPNGSYAESNSTLYLDILSNGFKPRTSLSETNGNGVSYIYAAFAENPFKYSNAR